MPHQSSLARNRFFVKKEDHAVSGPKLRETVGILPKTGPVWSAVHLVTWKSRSEVQMKGCRHVIKKTCKWTELAHVRS